MRELTARARTGEDASGSEDEDDGNDVSVPAVDVDALRASYAKSEKHVTTATVLTLRVSESETATWSLLGRGGENAAKEDAKGAMETVVEVSAAVEAREVEAKRKPAKRTKRKIAARESPGGESRTVLGIDEDSRIDDIVTWRAPDEKEMLDKWHEERDNWRDDYKKKRRRARCEGHRADDSSVTHRACVVFRTLMYSRWLEIVVNITRAFLRYYMCLIRV